MGHPFLISFLLNLLFYTNLTFPWRIYVENRNIYMGLVNERGEEDVENTTIRFKTGLGLNFFF